LEDMMARRTTLYAAFSDAGVPAINVHDFDKRRLSRLLSDRQANGDALPGEHLVRVRLDYYNRMMAERGWPEVTP
jgi:hypothetical protein